MFVWVSDIYIYIAKFSGAGPPRPTFLSATSNCKFQIIDYYRFIPGIDISVQQQILKPTLAWPSLCVTQH